MGLYTKPQITLLADLINEANPKYNVSPLAAENTEFGIPQAYSPTDGGIANTGIDATALPGSFFIGRIRVYYRRIDVSRLFANQVIRFDRWNNGVITPVELCEYLNQRFKTSFEPSDFPNFSYGSSSSPRTVTLVSTALCYQGTLTFIWEQGKRALDQIIPEPNIDGMTWDTYGTGDKPSLSLLGFGIDWTDYADTLNVFSNTSTVGSGIGGIIRVLNQRTGASLDTGTDHTIENGLGGLTLLKQPLPSTVIPGANSDDFNHVLVISAEDTSWFTGRLYLHYNWFRFAFLMSGAETVDMEVTRVSDDVTYHFALFFEDLEIVNGVIPEGNNERVRLESPLLELDNEYQLVVRAGSSGGTVVHRQFITLTA